MVKAATVHMHRPDIQVAETQTYMFFSMCLREYFCQLHGQILDVIIGLYGDRFLSILSFKKLL